MDIVQEIVGAVRSLREEGVVEYRVDQLEEKMKKLEESFGAVKNYLIAILVSVIGTMLLLLFKLVTGVKAP